EGRRRRPHARPRGRRPSPRVGAARHAGWYHQRDALRHGARGDRATADRARARARRRQPGEGRRRPRDQPEHAPEEDHGPGHRDPQGARRPDVSRLALPALYAIVDPLDTGREPLALAQAYLAGGARLLQLRAKGLTTRELHAAALALRSATRNLG